MRIAIESAQVLKMSSLPERLLEGMKGAAVPMMRRNDDLLSNGLDGRNQGTPDVIASFTIGLACRTPHHPQNALRKARRNCPHASNGDTLHDTDRGALVLIRPTARLIAAYA